jgi:hypothetical protein
MWTIKKLGYSSNPWRLVDEKGLEVYEEVTALSLRLSAVIL